MSISEWPGRRGIALILPRARAFDERLERIGEHDRHIAYVACGTSGPARIIGMPADSSYIVDLPHMPRVPRLSPWSDE